MSVIQPSLARFIVSNIYKLDCIVTRNHKCIPSCPKSTTLNAGGGGGGGHKLGGGGRERSQLYAYFS